MIRECVSKRDWWVGCYNGDGGATQCVIDTDHGALRIGLAGAMEKFFELRDDQVGQFRIAFDKAIMANRISTTSDDSQQRQWLLHCYSNYREPRACVIQICDGALQIICEDCFLELRAEQIGAFRIALNAALDVVRTDRTTYGEPLFDDADDDSEGLSPIGDEALFTSEINAMVAEEAPYIFALVEEVGDRVDAEIIAWGMAFPGHVEIMSADHNGVRGIFRSAQRAQQLLSVCNPIRLVWVSTLQAYFLNASSDQNDLGGVAGKSPQASS